MKYNILITGGNGGLARKITNLIKKTENKIFCHSNSENFDVKCDFSQIKDLQKIKQFIKDNDINCLINNAGIYQNKDITEISDEDVLAILNTNLVAPVIITKYFYKNLINSKREGLIININSLAGKYPNYKEAIYCASKFGLTGFSGSLSINQKNTKIKVIDCHLGAMKTKMTHGRDNHENMIDPENIAKFIVELIESKNDHIISSFEIRNLK